MKRLALFVLVLLSAIALQSQTAVAPTKATTQFFVPNPKPKPKFFKSEVMSFWGQTAAENATVSQKSGAPDSIVCLVRLVQTNADKSASNPAGLSCKGFPAMVWCKDPAPLEIKLDKQGQPTIGLMLLGDALRAIGDKEPHPTDWWMEKLFGPGGELVGMNDIAVSTLETLRGKTESVDEKLRAAILEQDRAIFGEFGMRGSVYDYIADEPLGKNVKITVYRHIVSVDKEGVVKLSRPDTLMPIATTFADSKGNFTLIGVPTRAYPDYIAIKFESAGCRPKWRLNFLAEKGHSVNMMNTSVIPLKYYEISQADMKPGDARAKLNRMLNTGGSRPELAKKPRVPNRWHDPTKVAKMQRGEPIDAGLLWVHEPMVGYNDGAGNPPYKQGPGWICMDERLAVACITSGELGPFTVNDTALQAQAVWIRSFAFQNNAKKNPQPANDQMAWNNWVSDDVLWAAYETEGQILVDENGKPFSPLFFARCNGDATMTAYPNHWTPDGKDYGEPLTCHVSVKCSGHCNCDELDKFGMTEQCKKIPITKRVKKKGKWVDVVVSYYCRFGHSAGACQRGIIDYCEKYGWSLEKAATYYYKGSKLVHRDYRTGKSQPKV